MKINHSIQPDTTDPAEGAISQLIYEELIAWSVRLNSGLATELEFNDFKKWCAQDPLHERAWNKLQLLEQNVSSLSPESRLIASETLGLASEQRLVNLKRRRTVKLLGSAAIGLFVTGLLANNYGLLLQDNYYVTAIGKREKVVLADGTTLLLNTNSKVNVKFSLFKREIVLHQGEIYIETGKDNDSIFGRRAFWVQTEQAAFEAIGTQFAVNQQSSITRLHVVEGVVAMHIASNPPVLAYANDTYTLRSDASHPVKNDSSRDRLNLDPMGWVNGVLVSKQMRLQDFAAELSRYQNTPVVCEPSVSELIVSGVFQLDRPDPIDHALKAIARALPVSIQNQGNALLITYHKK